MTNIHLKVDYKAKLIKSMMGKFYTNLAEQKLKIADKSAPAKICKPLSYIRDKTRNSGGNEKGMVHTDTNTYKNAVHIAAKGDGACVQQIARSLLNHAES